MVEASPENMTSSMSEDTCGVTMIIKTIDLNQKKSSCTVTSCAVVVPTYVK